MTDTTEMHATKKFRELFERDDGLIQDGDGTPITDVSGLRAVVSQAIVPHPLSRAKVPNPEAMTGDFQPAPELRSIGEKLIARRLPQVFDRAVAGQMATGGKRGGHAVYGKCVLLTGLAGYFGGADYAIWLAADHCQGFTNRQIEALLYHELLHIELDADTLKPKLRGHDFEAFRAEVREYGAWLADMEPMVETIRQLPLVDKVTGEVLR